MELYTAVAISRAQLTDTSLCEALWDGADVAAYRQYEHRVTALLARTTRDYWNVPGDLEDSVIIVSKWAAEPMPPARPHRRELVWASGRVFIGGGEVSL